MIMNVKAEEDRSVGLHFVVMKHGEKQSPEARRLARAHAMKVASKRNRDTSKKEGSNFRLTTVNQMLVRHGGSQEQISDVVKVASNQFRSSSRAGLKGAVWQMEAIGRQPSPSASRLDPFDALPENSPAIDKLLRSRKFEDSPHGSLLSFKRM